MELQAGCEQVIIIKISTLVICRIPLTLRKGDLEGKLTITTLCILRSSNAWVSKKITINPRNYRSGLTHGHLKRYVLAGTPLRQQRKWRRKFSP